MRTLPQIRELLNDLTTHCADELEAQDLDFKQWDEQSMRNAIKRVVDMAICMANGGGGTVVFGVNDKSVGRARAILGVPVDIDVNRLKKAVYDGTDPKLTPVFEDIQVPEGTGRLIVMSVFPGMPPYTDAGGAGTIRVGTDCQPLTGSMRRRIAVETGENDVTATLVEGNPQTLISASAMEILRNASRIENAPDELLRKSDVELLAALGVVKHDKLTRAGLLLAGSDDAIAAHLSGFAWTHLRMQSDTSYADRADGRGSILTGLAKLTDKIMADNPIATLEHGLFHFEYRTYPVIALREALLNAFCHADFRMPSPILVKQFADRIEISNPGGFVGGVSPENILHHPPVTRNPLLVDALTRLRLVNRSNLGIGRMYEAMLVEGKEPPLIKETGDAVIVTFLRRELSPAFRLFVAEQSQQGHILSVDELLITQYLLHHPELDTATACGICQRSEPEMREILSVMESQREFVERGGKGKGTYWMLRGDLHARLAGPSLLERMRRTNLEAAKTRILSILKDRGKEGGAGLTNSEIRRITRLDRFQVLNLLNELKADGQIISTGTKRGSRWFCSLDL